MPTSTTIRRTSFFMEPPSECVDPEELAEACGNRTHRSRVPPAPNGFEVRAGHQPRCASVRRVKYSRTQAKFGKRVIGSRGLRLRFLCGFLLRDDGLSFALRADEEADALAGSLSESLWKISAFRDAGRQAPRIVVFSSMESQWGWHRGSSCPFSEFKSCAPQPHSQGREALIGRQLGGVPSSGTSGS